MNRKLLSAAALFVIASVAPMHAQTPAPPAPPEATGSIGSEMTQDFMRMIAANALFKIESSRLAETRAVDPHVKRFAGAMIKDYVDANARLEAAAMQARIAAPLMKLDPAQADMLRDLEKANGEEFDRKYIEAQQNAHADGLRIYQTYAQGGANGALTAFARDMLPLLQTHKDEIDKMGQSRT
jgi:putative membrane protein